MHYSWVAVICARSAMVTGSARLKLASNARFAIMAFGALLLSIAAAQHLPPWQAALQALLFNACAYLGLRWPLLRGAIRGMGVDDRLSWSGAILGAAVGLTPAAVGHSLAQAYFTAYALASLAMYYGCGKVTCWFLGCCNFGSESIAQNARMVPLPLMEATAAFIASLTILGITNAEKPYIACAAFLCIFGFVRSASRILREPHKISESLRRFDAAPSFCLGAALLAFTQI